MPSGQLLKKWMSSLMLDQQAKWMKLGVEVQCELERMGPHTHQISFLFAFV